MTHVQLLQQVLMNYGVSASAIASMDGYKMEQLLKVTRIKPDGSLGVNGRIIRGVDGVSIGGVEVNY
jgi:hypothetical protein